MWNGLKASVLFFHHLVFGKTKTSEAQKYLFKKKAELDVVMAKFAMLYIFTKLYVLYKTQKQKS